MDVLGVCRSVHPSDSLIILYLPWRPQDPSIVLTNTPTSLDGRHQATCWGQAAAEISHAQARHWKVRDCRFPEPQSPPGHQRREYRDFDGDDFWCLCWTAGVPGLKLFWRLRQEMLNISNMKMKHYNCWVLVLIKTWGPSLSLNFQHWATLNIFTSTYRL